MCLDFESQKPTPRLLLQRNLRKSIFEGRAAAACALILLGLGGVGRVLAQGKKPKGLLSRRGAEVRRGEGGCSTDELALARATSHLRKLIQQFFCNPLVSVPLRLCASAGKSVSLCAKISVLLLLGAVGASAQTTNTNTITNGGTIGAGTTSLITNPTTAITGAITDNGLLLFQQNGLTITDAFVISGTGSLTMSGVGTTTLTGNNTYTGSTLISGGTLALGYGGVLYSGTWGNYVVTVTNGGVLQVGEWGDGALNNGGLQNNFYAANLVLAGGTLRYSATLADAGTMDRGFTIGTGGATLEAAGGTNTWNLVAGSRGVGIITANNNNLTLSGSNNGLMGLVFSGTGALTKSGSGTWTLTGTNTYTGGTIVNGGTLLLNASGVGTNTTLANNGSSTITVNNGGTLYFNVGNVFGYHTTTVLTPIVANAGGTVSGVSSFNILGPIYLNGGTLNSLSTDSFTGFGLKGNVTVNGGTNMSTISGSGFTLGSAAVTGVTFNVASGGTASGVDLLVSANIYNGAAPAWDPNTQASYLTKTGSGVMKLTGTNTYSGVTTISGGTLLAGTNNTLSANSSITLTNNASLIIGSTIQTTAGFLIENATFNQTNGSIAVNGNFRLGDVAGTTAIYNISAGTLTLGNYDEMFGASGSATVTQTGGSVTGVTWMTIGRYSGGSGNYSISGGSLSDTATGARLNVGEQGNGTLTISGSGSVTANGGLGISWNGGNGTVYLNGGNLSVASIAAGTAGGTSVFYFNGGTLNALAATNNFMSGLSNVTIGTNGAFINNAGYNISIGQNMAGTGSITLNGSGVTTLAGSNSFTGPVTVNGGILQINSDNALGAVPGSATNDITLNGGQLYNYNSSIALSANRNITLTSSNGYFQPWGGYTFTVNGQISGPGSLGISLDNGTVLLNGSNSYAGSTLIGTTNGPNYYGPGTPTLKLGNANALPYGNAVAFGTSPANTATLDLGGYSPFLTTLTGSSNAVVTNSVGSPTLTVGVSNASSTFSGAIKGALALTKTGTGTLTLSGANTETNLVINSGTVQVTGVDNALWGVATNTINSGGTLLGSSNSGTHLLKVVMTGGTIASPATLVSGSSASIWGTFDLDSGVTTTGSSNTSEISAVNVALTQAGGTIFNIASGSTNGIDLLVSGTFTEPSSMAPYTTTLIKQGNGVMVLAGTNSYTNATTISGGTLLVTGLLGNGSYAANITDNGSLIFSNSANQTLSGTLSGSGTFTQNGSATTTLSAANTFSGSTIVNAGRLVIGNTQYNVGAGSGSITVNNGGTLYFNSDNTFGNADTGSNSLVTITVNSGGQIQNGGTFNYLKTIILNGGQLIANGGGAGGWNAYELYNVTVGGTNASVISANSSVNGNNMILLSRSGTTTFAVADATGDTNADLLVSASLLDGNGIVGSLTKTGLGAMLLSSTGNAYSGVTTIGQGTLLAGTNNTFSPNSSVTLSNVAGTTLNLGNFNQTIVALNGGGSTGGTVSLGTATLTVGNNNGSGTFSGLITGTGGLVKTGTGVQGLAGSNSFSGGVWVNAGTLGLGDINALGTGILTMASNYATLLALTNGLVITNAIALNGNEWFDSGTYTITYNGVISGAGWIVYQGSGTTILGANNSYSGGTFLNAGTLAFGLPGAIGSGTLTFQSNAIVAATTSMTITNRVVINSGVTGTFNYGTNTITNSGAISGAGNFLKSGSGNLSLTASNTFTGIFQVNAGTVDFGTSGSIAPSSIYLGYNAGDAGIMKVGTGNTINVSSISPGIVMGYNGSGALYQSGGAINLNGGADKNAFPLGLNPGSYGFYQLSGGTASVPELGIGSYAGGNGIFQMTGGTFTSSSFFGVARADSTTNQMGEFDMLGGTFTASGGFSSALGFNVNSGKSAVVNFMGGTANLAQLSLSSTFGTPSGNLSVFNFNGGTVSAPSITGSTATGTNYVNFGGGTLTATISTNNFMGGVTATTIFTGGATINNGGNAITITNALAAPTGKGITNISISGSGSGYIGSPFVRITGGGGTGAAAMALVNPTTGQVTNVVITSPGWGYTSAPTITLYQGGGTNATATASIGTITGGGLTQLGSGTMILSGVNTYTGPTFVAAGVMQAGSTSAFGSNSAVTLSNVAGVVLNLNNYNNTIDSLNGGGASGGNLTLGTATLTIGAANGSGTFSGLITGSGGITKTGSGTETFTAVNSYTGLTIVSGGVLAFTSTNNLGTGSLIMTNGGSISFTGNSNASLSNSITISTGSSGGVGNGGAGTLTLAGSLSKNGGVLTLSGGSGGGINVTGAITGSSAGSDLVVNGGTVTLSTSNSYNGPTYIINGGTLVAAVANALPVASGLSAIWIDQTNGGSSWGSGAST